MLAVANPGELAGATGNKSRLRRMALVATPMRTMVTILSRCPGGLLITATTVATSSRRNYSAQARPVPSDRTTSYATHAKISLPSPKATGIKKGLRYPSETSVDKLIGTLNR
jgi:hypothetical protein